MSGRFSPEVMGGMGRLWHAPSGRAVAGRGSLTKQQLETSLRAVRGGPGGGGVGKRLVGRRGDEKNMLE